MRIYYFGELIEDTENPEIKRQKETQMKLDFEAAHQPEEKKSNLDAIADVLREIDLSLDIYRPLQFSK